MPLERSYLFVPGERPERFDKAVATGADRVIVDLEDAVRPDHKEAAREAFATWSGRTEAVVRINGLDSPWFEGDVAAVGRSGVTRVMVPKAEPEVLRVVGRELGSSVEIIALIESVAGLMQSTQICADGGVGRLAFGNLDFSLDAGIDETDRELDPVRLRLVLESRYARLPPPIDGVFPSLADPAALALRVARAKALGFGGKLCIHPGQVESVNLGFLPGADELAWAERVVAAVEAAGGGAVSLDGKMVDRPVVERARVLLAGRHRAT